MTDPDHTLAELVPEPSSPSAEVVRQLVRAQNIKLGIAALVLFVVGGVGVYYSAGGRAASQDSFNAANAQYASQARSACITERRNAELHAIGDAIAALGRAQIAGLLDRDTAEAANQRRLFEAADERRLQQANSLLPDVLDQPPPVGCGPPILGPDDVPPDTPTTAEP